MQMKADNILIKPLPWPEQKHGSIILPDNQNSRKQLSRGQIVAMGPGGWTQQGIQLPPEMKIGEYAYYLMAGATPVIIDGWEHHIVSERQILMTLTEDETKGDSTNVETNRPSGIVQG